MSEKPRVLASYENDERNRCIDIIVSDNGRIRFQEWRREPEDLSGWFLTFDSMPHQFASEAEATAAARLAIAWFDHQRSSARRIAMP